MSAYGTVAGYQKRMSACTECTTSNPEFSRCGRGPPQDVPLRPRRPPCPPNLPQRPTRSPRVPVMAAAQTLLTSLIIASLAAFLCKGQWHTCHLSSFRSLVRSFRRPQYDARFGSSHRRYTSLRKRNLVLYTKIRSSNEPWHGTVPPQWPSCSCSCSAKGSAFTIVGGTMTANQWLIQKISARPTQGQHSQR